ncbi:baseplate J/gp47 family protein [Hazenella sp. IB182357]|uniref:Baseplate J/gp47 family protein n=1 Tax=Polycladospora coralii TaxID=2771432 RepID=A0A926RUN4_9BACL|nr:baseplate J/gp47 family protein [Polycladospora coralii]MBD1372584.1 baseplate J/gp47 family protein [Polycladospora coralii]
MRIKMRSFQDILTGMADWMLQRSKRLLDFSVGSTLRTMLEAVATEIEEFYYRTQQNFQWAIEHAIYESFDFKRREAVKAYGELDVYFSQPLPTPFTIPEGVRFATSGTSPLYFETTRAYQVATGAEGARIEVRCLTSGVVGNVDVGAITIMTQPLSMVAWVSNPSRFLTGKEAESAADRKQRFARFVQARGRGTVAALEYGAFEVPEVSGVYVDDSEIGFVKLYCHDQNGDLPPSVQVAVTANLHHYRPAGIPVRVLPTVKVTPALTVELAVTTPYLKSDFQDYIEVQIETYLNAFTTAEDLLLSNLNQYIRALEPLGITNCTIVTPASDIQVASHELIRSGVLTVMLKEAEA